MDGTVDISQIKSNGTRNKPFATGLRVLAIDNNPVCLKVVKVMLKKCEYEVVAVQEELDAIKLLRKSKGGFDIILTSVHMSEINGFQLLDIVTSEFNIPVIILSGDDNKSIITKALESGACFSFLKPLKMREVQNLWQFIFTSWRYPNTAKSTSHIEDSYTNQTGDDEEASSSVNEDNWMDQECNKKVGKEDGENKKDETTATKKARVVWTSELHDQFLQAIRQIGIDRAVPKRILEVMNVQGLTRENVASHLQKYRLYVRRYQDPNHPGEARHTSGMSNNSSNHVLAQDPHLSSYNLSSRFPRFSTQRLHAPQQRQWMPFQSGCSGNGSSSNMNPIISQYFSSELSNNNALDQKIYGGTIQMCNQENMRQPWVGSMLSLNEQSFSSYPNYGMQPKSLTISDSFIHGRRQMLGMDHQQSQVTKGHTSNGMIDQNFSTSNFQGIINFQSNSEMGVENMASCDTWNQVINLDATNNDYPGGIVGAVTIGPFESVKFNENHIDVEGGGKIPIGEEIDPYDVNISSVDYLTQDGNSSSGFVNVNQFQGIISTTLSLPEQQQKQGEIDNDTWTNYLRNNSLEETFNGDDLETFVFNQQGGEGMMDFEFDINTFEMDDIENNPLA